MVIQTSITIMIIAAATCSMMTNNIFPFMMFMSSAILCLLLAMYVYWRFEVYIVQVELSKV